MRDAYVIGNVNVDVVIGTFERWPGIGSEVLGYFFDFRYAGAAGNSAMALTHLLQFQREATPEMPF